MARQDKGAFREEERTHRMGVSACVRTVVFVGPLHPPTAPRAMVAPSPSSSPSFAPAGAAEELIADELPHEGPRPPPSLGLGTFSDSFPGPVRPCSVRKQPRAKSAFGQLDTKSPRNGRKPRESQNAA